MAEATPLENITEAMMELRCISEIMTELGEDAIRDDGMLPAAWMIWLGGCVRSATAKVSDAMNGLNQSPLAKRSA